MLVPHVSRFAGTASLRCTECDTFVIDPDAVSGEEHDGCPKAPAYTVHLDVKLEVANDGSTVCTIDVPGGFDLPLAEDDGESPRAALECAMGALDLSFDNGRLLDRAMDRFYR